LATHLVETNTDFLCGDINMSLWKVVPELASRSLTVTLIAFYPWQCTRGGGATTPEEATASTQSEVKYDSCGIFAVKYCTEFFRLYPEEQL
jgi:hypothetical protein